MYSAEHVFNAFMNTLLIVLIVAIPIVIYAGWRKQKDDEHELLKEYDQLMKRQGFFRSQIGKTTVWLPNKPLMKKDDDK